MATRTWAREITTSYAYNPAGDLAAVNYDDNQTPGTTHTYDRRSRCHDHHYPQPARPTHLR